MDSRKTEDVFCLSLFVAFVFCYFCFMAGEQMAFAVHRICGIDESFVPFVGAMLMTVLLWAVQMSIQRMKVMQTKPFALGLVPSLLLMPLLSHLVPSVNYLFVLLTIALLLMWLCRVKICRQERTAGLCRNLTILLLGMTYVAVATNANDIKLYELRMLRHITQGEMDKALRVGEKSLATNAHLVNLRAYALNRQQTLGEHLFEYALPEGYVTLQTVLKGWDGEMLPTDGALRDYKLCGLLLQKQLDNFAVEIRKAVDAGAIGEKQMPRHYREALILYKHLRKHPVWVYANADTEQDYRDFMEVYHREPQSSVRRNTLRRLYGGTFWWYYFFH